MRSPDITQDSYRHGEEKAIRLFIAIEIPFDIKTAIIHLRTDIPGAKWVPPEQVHLTLSFLGEVEDATTNLLITELKTITAKKFDLRFSTPGCFPNQRRPRVLWVGLKPEPQLNRLADKIINAVTACGIQQEERPFSPHITLARIKQPVTVDIQKFLEQRTDKLSRFPVDEFILFQSHLTSKGAVHTALRKFALQ